MWPFSKKQTCENKQEKKSEKLTVDEVKRMIASQAWIPQELFDVKDIPVGWEVIYDGKSYGFTRDDVVESTTLFFRQFTYQSIDNIKCDYLLNTLTVGKTPLEYKVNNSFGNPSLSHAEIDALYQALSDIDKTQFTRIELIIEKLWLLLINDYTPYDLRIKELLKKKVEELN